MEPVLLALAAAALTAWLGVLLLPARPWDLHPIAEDELRPPEPDSWPSVAIVVPARDEAAALPHTLPALLAQDYPGPWRVVLVDDRSSDGTAAVARGLRDGSARLTVVDGEALPAGWVGKVWALEQGVREAARPEPDPAYILFTDADIRHGPRSLRRLVGESEAAGLALNSRMARLRCRSLPERLLIPPFLLFFNLLYPMRLANDPRRRLAAAAGGCVLLRPEALERAGGLESIRDEVIDDVNLARAVKVSGGRIRLSLSREDVVSIREYETVGPVWRMVRRSAFDQLRYSWLLLVGTVAGLLLLFAVPAGLPVIAIVLGVSGTISTPTAIVAGSLAASAFAVSARVYLPCLAYFGLQRAWTLTLPLGGLLYGGMTVDSARLHLLGRDRAWS